ncbi:UNVERIFIED_CONTAM: hypothetical protein FKN15_067217 [Acipenser sinensis]
MNTRCPPKHVPSAARFFTLCRLTVQPPQSYSIRGQRSSGQLTGKPAGARPDYRGRWYVHMLSKVGTWNFDIFLFDRLTNGNSLVTLLCHLFNGHGLIHHFQLDMVKLHRFLVMVQEDYHSQNPYHNAVHAADVTQAMHCYLKEPRLARYLTPLDIFLGLLAATAHDVDHPGVNQPFLVKTKHHLASLYQIALKCADICNPCRVWEMSKQWSERVCEEFYRQGDLETKFELEISPLCNQHMDTVPAIQIGFMTYLVEPLFDEWRRFTDNTPLTEAMMSHLRKNKARWRALHHNQHHRGDDGSGQRSEVVESGP